MEKHNSACTKPRGSISYACENQERKTNMFFDKKSKTPTITEDVKKRKLTQEPTQLTEHLGCNTQKIKVVSRLLISISQHHPSVLHARYHFPIPSACPFPRILLGLSQPWKNVSLVPYYKGFPHIIK